MTRPRNEPQATYLEPFVGWRCWRVLPMQTLSEGRRYRLCAAGTYGVPKAWPPRAAVVAQCSSYKSRHEAPHPNHECGIYGFSSEAEAAQKFAEMAHANSSRGTIWAFGRVSLWGRVVECELGWRAQFAYPYDIAVFTDGKAADGLAAEYAIDVERRPRSELRALKATHAADEDGEWVQTISGDYAADWYRKSLYGRLDRTFLKPYHEDVSARLDRIDASIARLAILATENGGRDVN
jgi:hypothetical protein